MNNSSSSSSYFNGHQHPVFSQPSYYQGTSATDLSQEDYFGPNEIGTDTQYYDDENPVQDTGGWLPAQVNARSPHNPTQQSFAFPLQNDLPQAAYGAIRDHPSSNAYAPSWTTPQFHFGNGVPGHGASDGPQSSGPSWPMSHYAPQGNFAQPTDTLSAPAMTNTAANARHVASATSHHSHQSYPPSRPANNHAMYRPPVGLDAGQYQRMTDSAMHHLDYANVPRHQPSNTQPAYRYTGDPNVSQRNPNSYKLANNHTFSDPSNLSNLPNYSGHINPDYTFNTLRQPQQGSGMINPTYTQGQPINIPTRGRYMPNPGQSHPGEPNVPPYPSNSHNSHIRTQLQSPNDPRRPNYLPSDTAAFQNERPPPQQPPRPIDRNPRPHPPPPPTQRAHPCPYCDQSRRSEKELKVHTDDMHGTATTHYVCIDCFNAGKTKQIIRLHRIKEHCEKKHKHSSPREDVHYWTVQTAPSTKPNRRNNEARGSGHRR